VIGHKDHADVATGEVVADPLPKLLGISIWKCLAQPLLTGAPLAVGGGLKRGSQFGKGPVAHGIGRVVEHLPDDLASDPRVRRLLDLHDHWDAVSIDKQMVDTPDRPGTLGGWHTHLPPDQQQRPRGPGGSATTGKHGREGSKCPLEQILAAVGPLLQDDQPALTNQEDASSPMIHLPSTAAQP
jgi:hypothetical protein